MGDTRSPADTLDELLALPGIGPYTARAVLAFAYERDVGVLDVNVGAQPRPARTAVAVSQAEADALVPAGRGLGLEPGAARPRRHRLHGACAEVRRLPGVARRLRVAPAGGDDPVRRAPGSPPSRAPTARAAAAWSTPSAAAPSPPPTCPRACGWPDDPDRAHRIAASLVTDGLAVTTDGVLTLPGS